MISAALALGVPKRALLEDYYPGELAAILAARAAPEPPEVLDPLAFFGDGGETV